MLDPNSCFIDCMGKIQKLDIIEGVSYHELRFLQTLLARVVGDGTVVVEIGSWKGCSTYFIAHILNHFNSTKMYCIDTWGGNAGTWNIDVLKNQDIRKIFEHNIKEFQDIITVVNENSLTAHTHFTEGTIDFLFIDGDHTYDNFYSDLSNYYSKVRKGGIICGHDCNVKFENLTKQEQDQINRFKNQDCVLIKSLGKRIHCGVTKALYDFFGSEFKRSEEIEETDADVKNSIWWKIK